MKTRIKAIGESIFMVAFVFISLGLNSVLAQEISKPLKLGTFDSRIVTLAFSRSDHFKKVMDSFKEGESIMESNDTAKKVETFYKVFTKQYLMHQQVFSNGSSAYLLELVKDQLPQLAKNEGVFAIVSKWELTFADPKVEVVDLTMPICMLFKPSGDFDRMVPEMQKQTPIPLEEFTVEEVVQAWKQFEGKYLGKK